MVWSSTLSFLAVVALIGAPAPVSEQAVSEQAASQQDVELCYPGLAEIPSWASEVRTGPAEGECPCFDRWDLAALATDPLDHCISSALVTEVASWYGERIRGAQSGFHLMVTTPSPRCTVSTCVYLKRDLSSFEPVQVYREFEELDASEYRACWGLLVDWLTERGGCAKAAVADQ